eukprot:tig00001049_g6659.t1
MDGADNNLMEAELRRLVDEIPDQKQREASRRGMEAFKVLYQRWRAGAREQLDWRKIGTPPVVPYESIQDHINRPFGVMHMNDPMESEDDQFQEPDEEMPSSVAVEGETERIRAEDRELLDKLVVLKLNGGLGTTMGCTGPKSTIEVRNELTFLDLTVRQIQGLNRAYGTDVPLVLMNSFNTESDTKKTLSRYKKKINVQTFMQKKFPRILKESHMPMAASYTSGNEAWYPPGHGDVFDSLFHSDLFEKLRAAGKEYIFISNIDNLGATVDLNIARYMAFNRDCEFVMEVTDRTRSDVKGGVLIDYGGHRRLLEVAQVPPSKREEFNSIKKFNIFNTNNLWVRLDAVEKRLPELSLDIIVNNKQTKDGTNVIQLETAAGAAIQHFRGAVGINVPRHRFLPVKGTSDLFVVQSNLYNLEHNCLRLSPKRVQLMGSASLPVVKLGDNFSKVADYNSRFKAIPDILELDHLTVSGDVTFGSDVALKGTVIIVANHGSRIDIPSGSILENKVVSGNLRILDH